MKSLEIGKSAAKLTNENFILDGMPQKWYNIKTGKRFRDYPKGVGREFVRNRGHIMKDLTLDEAVEAAKSYYIENNLSIPNSVVSYMSCFPKGMSRQMIQARYGIKTSEFVKLLNPKYSKPLDAQSRALKECSRLNYTLLSDPSTLSTNRDRVQVQCIDCNYIHETTITSLSGTVLGCPKCKSGNLPWYKRRAELQELLLDIFEATLVSDIPINETGYITVKHLECDTEYTTQLLGFTCPSTPHRGTCPNCRSSDKRVTVEGITFGSTFEYECFKLLKRFNPETHIKYSDYFNTTKRWVCDFKIGSYWIEVSNFKTDYKNYFENIRNKELLVESNGNHFFFIRSLKEMEEFVSLI